MRAALLKHGLPTARKLVGMWGSDPCSSPRLCISCTTRHTRVEYRVAEVDSGFSTTKGCKLFIIQSLSTVAKGDCPACWKEFPKLLAKAVTGICGYGLTPKMMQMSMNLLLFSHIPINFPLSWHRNISQFCNFLMQLAMLESTNKTCSYFFSIPVSRCLSHSELTITSSLHDARIQNLAFASFLLLLTFQEQY